MSFTNCGAFIAGHRAPSKKALKITLADQPGRVTFDPTSMFNDQAIIRGDAIPAGVKLSVVGPDPYSDRRFYATIEMTPKGVKLS